MITNTNCNRITLRYARVYTDVSDMHKALDPYKIIIHTNFSHSYLKDCTSSASPAQSQPEGTDSPHKVTAQNKASLSRNMP